MAPHAVADVHDTPVRTAPVVGVGWIDQAVPFQRSARVLVVCPVGVK
jgi:hypothetical protein